MSAAAVRPTITTTTTTTTTPLWLANMDDVVGGESINTKPTVVPASKRYFRQECCSKMDPTTKFELKECFPYAFDPLSYLVWDRLPFLKWLGVMECFRWCVAVGRYFRERVSRFPRCGKVYGPETALGDLVAGLTVGIMVVPQALAYAKIADLPIEYGLFSAFMGVIVYAFFGTSKDVTLGPTAILSLITASAIRTCGVTPEEKVPCAIQLTVLCGIIQLAMGILNLGFLIDFIPLPIISGFTSGAAITIAGGQLKHIIGVNGTHNHTMIGDFVLGTWVTLKQIPQLKPWDLVMGLCCIALVVFLQLFKTHNLRVLSKLENPHLVQKIAHKFLWILCTARSGVVILIAALIGFAIRHSHTYKYDLTNSLITFVDFNENNTLTAKPPPFDPAMIEELGVGIIMAPLIGFLETIAISKAFARQNEYIINPTQELIAIGMANIVSSFVGSYPVTGSFSRTAVNSQSGAMTPAAGIITAGVVLVAIYGLGKAGVFDYIPQTALAAIIIPAVLLMFDWRTPWNIWKVRKLDLLPLIIAFLGTIFLGVEYGVPAACLLYIIILLYREARTRHRVVMRSDGILCLEMNGGWNYPSVNYIWNRISSELDTRRDLEGGLPIKAVVIDCASMPEVDYTTIIGLKDGCKDLNRKGIQLFLVRVQDQVVSALHRANMQDLNIFATMDAVLQCLGDSDIEVPGEHTGLLVSNKKL